MARTTTKKRRKRLYACCGCGDITTGCVSESTGNEYDCCRDCAERVDAMVERTGRPFEDEAFDDRGPYRDRRPFPKCPACGATRTELSTDDEHGWGTSLECPACDHHWTPRGIYLDKP